MQRRNYIKAFDQPVYVTKPMLPSIDQLRPHLDDIWRTAVLTNGGPKHIQLEEKIAEILGGHVSLFNNGTIALQTVVRGLGLNKKVIVTPFTFAATVHALALNGIEPVFADIDPVTSCISPEAIEAVVCDDTSGILGVHVFGNLCDFDGIDAISRKRKLMVVYDAAHAFGTRVNGHSIARQGHASVFSFHATKLFHTFEGGAVVSSSHQLKSRLDLMKNFGIVNEEVVDDVGTNGKMNELQAAVGLCCLDLFREEKKKRSEVASAYLNGLRGIPGIKLPFNVDADADSMQYFCIRVNEDCAISRNDLHNALRSLNVFTRKYFYPLCSEFPVYRSLPTARRERLPIAVKAVSETLCLPYYGSLPPSQVLRIVEMVRYFCQAGSV